MSHSVALIGGRVLLASGELGRYSLLLEGSRVGALLPPDHPLPADAEVLSVDDCLVAPGFLDTHVHGAMGRNFMEGSPEAVAAIARHLASGGVTTFLATTTTAPRSDVLKAVAGLSALVGRSPDGQPEMAGIHLEGPFLNVRFSGSQAPQHVRPATDEELQALWEAGGPALKVVTLAPEVPLGMEAVHFFTSRGVQVSMGHSGATYQEAKIALAAGVRRCTHLFNALPPIHHRDPGPVTALLEDSGAFLEVIVDGQHLHPAIVALVARHVGPDRIIPISDSCDVAGQGDGLFTRWDGSRVIVKEGRARTQAGSLAGSTLTISQAVANLVNQAGIPLATALRMASETPARAIGLAHRKGRLLPGWDADVVVLGPDLSVRLTIARGQVIHDARGSG